MRENEGHFDNVNLAATFSTVSLGVVNMGLATLIATIILVDFLSGVVHWAEDTFGQESTFIVGKWIVRPNVIHHRDATAFVANSWFQSSWDLLAACVPIVVVAWWFDALSWPVWIFVVLGANANQIHKWSHTPAADLPVPVRALQQLGLLQGSKHHAAHHRADKNTAYCVITPWVNPVLDRLGFWRILERATVPVFGAPRRTDLSYEA